MVRLIEQRDLTALEERNSDKSGDEAADMRREGHAGLAGRRHRGAEELPDEPDAEHDQSRHMRYGDEEAEDDEHSHRGAGMQEDIGAEHARHGAARADHRN